MKAFIRFVKIVVSILIVVLVIATIGLGSVYFYFAKDLPNIQSFGDYKPPVVSEVFAEDGTKMGEFWIERRFVVPIDQIPNLIIQSFIAAEDARFFEHKGVDVRGVGRAFFENLKAGHVVQGGSTITQQVTRSILLTTERSYVRKIKEAILATRIDRTLSKKEILEIYLNQIFLGNRAYGVRAGAENYFHKDMKDITLAEAAMLGGLTQAPGSDNPVVNPTAAKERQKYVLKRMYEVGYITKQAADEAAKVPLTVYINGIDKDYNYQYAPYFTEEVRKQLIEKYGEKVLYEGGLKIYTTADVKLNQVAQKAVKHGIEELCHRQTRYNGPAESLKEDAVPAFLANTHRSALVMAGETYIHFPPTKEDLERLRGATPMIEDKPYPAVITGFADGGKTMEVAVGNTKGAVKYEGWRWIGGSASTRFKINDVIYVETGAKDGEFKLSQIPQIQAALFSMVPETGYVKALAGGFDYKYSEFNRATQALRQPGSSFKPVIYSSALDKGYTYSTNVSDSPVSYKVGDEVWSPKNYGGKYSGNTTFESDLIHSRNVPTVKIAQSIGTHYITAYARKLGLTNNFHKYLSMALGANSVYLQEMVTAFSTIANFGRRPDRVFILKVVDDEGRVIEEYTPPAGHLPIAAANLYAKNVDPKSTDLNTALFDANKKFIELDGLKLSDEELRILYGKAIPDGYVMTPQTAYLMLGMMQNVVKKGTGARVQVLARPVAGKTGTTNDETDAWFIGFVPDLAAGVWIGYDVKKNMGRGEQGGRTAAPIFIEYMKEALKDVPPTEFMTLEDIPADKVAALKGGSAIYCTGLEKDTSGGAEWLGVTHTVHDRAVDFFEEDMGY